MQSDGNLVLYMYVVGVGIPQWSSGSFRAEGAYHLSVRDDGRMVIYEGANPTVRGAAIWVGP